MASSALTYICHITTCDWLRQIAKQFCIIIPYHYEICLLPTKVQKCYGCGSDFVDKYRKPPFNLVVKHVDRRVIRRNEVTGQLVFSHDYSNTYYHPSCAHIRRKNRYLPALSSSPKRFLLHWNLASVLSMKHVI